MPGGDGCDDGNVRVTRPRWGGWLAVVSVLLVAGCGDGPEPSPPPPGAWTVHDAEGRIVTLPAPAGRVISLVPSVTATIVALGAEERLVGRTDFDRGAAVAHLPSVGAGLGPDLEAVVALDPDLVIRFGGESDRTTPERLDHLGIPHLAVRPDGIDDVFTTIEQVGRLLGVADAARALGDSLRMELDATRAEAASRPPVRTAYLMGGSPPWAAGEGSYIDDLITLAGGINVLADVSGLYGAVSPEVVATRRIEVLLVAEGAEIDPRLLEGRRVARLPSSIQQPGPDLGASARAVAAALRGGEGR